jgi:hypothetical protein
MIRVRGLLILLLLLPAVPTVAQTRLFALFSGTYPCSELAVRPASLIDIGADSGRINGTTPITPGWGWSSPAVTPDGSYLVFGGYRSPGAHLDALDTSSYGVTSFYVSVTSPTFGYAVHPGTSRAYFQRPDDEQLFVVDASGVRPWPALTSQRPGWLRLISGDGSRLVIHRHLTSEAAVVDTDTGVTSGVVSDVAGVVAVNSDGTEIYSLRQDSFAAPCSGGWSRAEPCSPPRT